MSKRPTFMQLQWRTVTPSTDPRYLVKGTVLAVAYVPGTLKRFALYMVRAIDADGAHDVAFQLRDAALISDAEVREGNLPPIVAQYHTLDEAIAGVEQCLDVLVN